MAATPASWPTGPTPVCRSAAIVKHSDNIKGFHVLPRRWVVERTLGWIIGHRRFVRDYERLPTHLEAMIRITSRRLTKIVQEQALSLIFNLGG